MGLFTRISTAFKLWPKITPGSTQEEEIKHHSEFTLKILRELRTGQRREFLRIVPPTSSVISLRVWPTASTGLPQWASFEAAREACREWTPDIALVNISAAGLCINIKKHPDNPIACAGVGSRLLVFLRLKNSTARQPLPPGFVRMVNHTRQGSAKTLNFWLGGTVRYRMEEEEEETGLSSALLGINFNSWLVPGALVAEKRQPVWAKVDNGGEIPLLASWVWRQHLTAAAQQRGS